MARDTAKPKPAGTAATAAETRTAMQRRHLWTGLGMAAAFGAEVAGAAGMVVGGVLGWEWGEPLWGRTDQPGLVVQVALALAVLALVAAWLSRAYQTRTRLRLAAATLAAVVAAGAVMLLSRAELGSRGPGAVVTAVAAAVAVAGALGWVLGMRRLRALFPYDLNAARVGGYGNLAAVRRARLAGGPAGVLGGTALVAGAFLVGAGMVSTESTGTAEPLALRGDSPSGSGGPAWEIDLAATEAGSDAVWATPGGLVIGEVQGIRGVDPRDGRTRWHWRDDAYRRAATAVIDSNRTVVLGLEYQGDRAGRDRVVALDTATGEVRWDRYDDELVAAMSRVVVSPEEGDWFIVPEMEQAAETAGPAPVGLRAVGRDGTRWRVDQPDGCGYVAVRANAPGVVVTAQECAGADGDSVCQVDGLDPATGEPMWTWPDGEQEGRPVSQCQVTAAADLLFISHQAAGQQAAVALDPRAGTEVWTAQDGPAGLSNPVVAGDAVLGTEWAGDGSGGGQGTLVIRDAADGQLRDEVALPAGQPIGVAAVREGVAVVTHYRPESAEVMLLEVDVAAAAVTAETVVDSTSGEDAFRAVNLSTGPETLTVDTLTAPGQNPAPDDYTLHVYGW